MILLETDRKLIDYITKHPQKSGANRAKLREIGATEYKSYGALSDYDEAKVRLLISQMLEKGYLSQTDDIYSVLHMGPEMNKLYDENTHVRTSQSGNQ